MGALPARIFWAVARFIALTTAGLQLAKIYVVEEGVLAWLKDHRDITTIMLAGYVVCEVLYISATADAAEARRRGKQIVFEVDDDEHDQ